MFLGAHGFGDWQVQEMKVAASMAAKDPLFRYFLVLLPGAPEPLDSKSLPAFITLRSRINLREGFASPRQLEPLIELYPSPGMTDSVTTLYLATGCLPVPTELHGPEEEHSRLLHVPLEDAMAMIDDGRIADAKTVVGILLTERRLRANDLTV